MAVSQGFEPRREVRKRTIFETIRAQKALFISLIALIIKIRERTNTYSSGLLTGKKLSKTDLKIKDDSV